MEDTTTESVPVEPMEAAVPQATPAETKTEIAAPPLQDAPPAPATETMPDGTVLPVVEIVPAWPDGRRHYVVVED